MKKKTENPKQVKTGGFIDFLNAYGIFFLIFIFGVLYSIIAITKYIHFQTGLDIAIYVQTFWFYAHLKLPYVTLYPTFGDLVWADHFSPSLMILTPLYWIWHDPKALLLFQSFALVTGAFPLFVIAKKFINSNALAYAFAFVYLTFFGVQYPITFDFHLATIAASFLPWIIWALASKKWKTFIVLCILMAGFKEDAPFYLSALALYMIFTRKNWKLGIVMFVFSFSYGIAVAKYIMPSLAHNAVKTFSVSYFNLNPNYLFSVFFNSSIKIRTMFLSFSNMLFLPILSGFFLLLPFAHFFINFSNPSYPGRWDLYLHYRSYLSALMVFGSILGYSFLMKKIPNIFDNKITKIIISLLLVLNTIFFDVTLHLPLNILYKRQFYFSESWIRDDSEVIKKIPQNAYLLTLNNLSPQVSYREHVFFFPQKLDKADYIFLDTRPNQPIINFWLTAESNKEYQTLIKDLILTKRFSVTYKVNDAILLKRNN